MMPMKEGKRCYEVMFFLAPGSIAKGATAPFAGCLHRVTNVGSWQRCTRGVKRQLTWCVMSDVVLLAKSCKKERRDLKKEKE